MRIENVSKIKYSIKLKSSPAKKTNRKPVYGFLSLPNKTARPFAFYTPESSTIGQSALRSHVVVPTVTLMHGNVELQNGNQTTTVPAIVPIYNLPYNLVKLIFHHIYDYDDDTLIESFLDTRLYNPNIVCIDRTDNKLCDASQQNVPFEMKRNVFGLLHMVAQLIKAELELGIQSNGSDSNIHELIEILLNKYSVFFIFDNVDDFNVFVSFLAYSGLYDSTTNSISFGWRQHMLFVRWSPDFGGDANINGFGFPSLVPTSAGVHTYSPFTTYYTEAHIPMSLFQTYNRALANPLSYHMRNDSDVIIWMYITSQGLGTFSSESTNNTNGNEFTKITEHMYRFNYAEYNNAAFDFYNISPNCDRKNMIMNCYLYYLDYHPDNWNVPNNDVRDKKLIGVGFIVKSASGYGTDNISFVDYTTGRFFLSNTDGIFLKNHWLTAILHFLVLREMGFKPIASFRFNDLVDDIKTYNPVAYTQRSNIVYAVSPDLDKVKAFIRKTEYRGITFRVMYDTSHSTTEPYTFYVGLDKDTLEEINISLPHISNHKFESLLQTYIPDLITIRTSPDFFNIFIDFMKDMVHRQNSNIGGFKVFDYRFNVPDMEPYHSEPAIITNNTENDAYRYYYKYLSDAYSQYGYYDNNTWLHEPNSVNMDDLISQLLTSNHPALILYDSKEFEWPMSKRNQRYKSKRDVINQYNILIKRNVRYMQFYDYINYANPSIISQLQRTQDELVYPLNLSDKTNFMPVVLDINYMYNNDYATFVTGNLINSGEILRYPMMPRNNFNPSTPLEAEINQEEGLYYREVLYHKYMRYLVLSILYHVYHYPDQPYEAPDVINLVVQRGVKRNEVENRDELNIEISFGIRLYDNRIIRGENVELIFVF